MKKDHELIAKVLKYAMQATNDVKEEEILNVVIHNISYVLWADNSGFNRTNFEETAGYCAKVPHPDSIPKLPKEIWNPEIPKPSDTPHVSPAGIIGEKKNKPKLFDKTEHWPEED